jgi:hypothetical protein
MEFGHGLRSVPYPKVVDVLQAAPTAKPRSAKALERVPAHPFAITFHLDEPRCRPTRFEIAVQMRCIPKRPEKLAILAVAITLHELGNVWRHVDLTIRGASR